MDSKLDQGHFCPWHEEDVLVRVLRVEGDGNFAGQLICEPCPRSGPSGCFSKGETLHDDNTNDFCWCVK